MGDAITSTGLLATSEAIKTGAAVTSGASSAVAVAATLGMGVVVPPLIPALVGVGILVSFISKQVGLNSVLKTQLFYVKMQVERMYKIFNILEMIICQNKIKYGNDKIINLNTKNLSAQITIILNKIAKYASPETIAKIQKLYSDTKDKTDDYLKDQLKKVDADADTLIKEDIVKPKKTIYQKITGWSARWLSPEDTLREILQDLATANVWFSILLGDFQIFILYFYEKLRNDVNNPLNQKNGPNIKGCSDKIWYDSNELYELLITNDLEYSPYNTASSKELKDALSNINTSLVKTNEQRGKKNQKGGSGRRTYRKLRRF